MIFQTAPKQGCLVTRSLLFFARFLLNHSVTTEINVMRPVPPLDIL